jgi:hypothetical protein
MDHDLSVPCQALADNCAGILLSAVSGPRHNGGACQQKSIAVQPAFAKASARRSSFTTSF